MRPARHNNQQQKQAKEDGASENSISQYSQGFGSTAPGEAEKQ
jgi:hypothetical protein